MIPLPFSTHRPYPSGLETVACVRRLASLALSLLLASCAGGGPETGRWLLPEEGARWHRAERLAVLVIPEEVDSGSFRVSLNGEDVTGRFLPLGHFNRQWSLRAGADLLTGKTLGPGVEARDHRRALAVLERDLLREGENLLVARVGGPNGAAARVERRFRFEPRGRAVRLRVARGVPGGLDEGAAARVILEPLEGAPSLDLSAGEIPLLEPREGSERRSFVFVRGGETLVHLPEGRYRALATGGPLDEVQEWTVPARGEAEHRFVLRRSVSVPDAVSVDFHVHAASSRDSLVPLEERLWSFAAAGVDLLVASDHHHVTDYSPVLARVPRLDGRVGAIPGVETGLMLETGDSLGHWNVWPLDPDPDAGPSRRGGPEGGGALPPPRLGTPQSVREDLRPVPRLYEAYRERARELARRAGRDRPEVDPVVVELNHPRGIHFRPAAEPVSPKRDFFDKVGFDPSRPLLDEEGRPAGSPLLHATEEGLTALDVDCLEVLNRNSAFLYLHVRRDWFALLSQGWRPTGVANTDTHTLSPGLAGYPMNLVFLETGLARGAATEPADLARAVRAGRVVGTDGPVPLLRVSHGGRSAGPGELISAGGGGIRARVEVRAASWVPVEGVRLWANGRVVATAEETGTEGEAPRALLETELRLERDTWILAEVGDPEAHLDGAPLPGLYGRIVPRGIALGFTNPIFVDVDGNGRFDPPGLEAASLPPVPG